MSTDPNKWINTISQIKKEDNFEKEKEPKMFEDSESEENFEIPAFLRRQKN